MTLYRKGDDPATLALTVIAMLTLAVSLIVLLAVEKPDTKDVTRKYQRRQMQASNLKDKAQDNIATRQASIVAQTWNLPEQQVGPAAMANVTRLVNRHGLKVISFRPQRRSDEGNFVQLPYLLTVEGEYLSVLRLVDDLEQPSTKLAVTLVQIASADAGSNQVTASVGLSAYLTPKETKTGG